MLDFFPGAPIYPDIRSLARSCAGAGTQPGRIGRLFIDTSIITMTYLKRSPAAGIAALAIVAGAAALATPGPARGDELANLINAYRAAPTACDGAAVTAAPPLTPEAALARLRIVPGTFLEPALKRLGYRAERAEALSVSGADDLRAAFEVLQRKYCRTLLSREFSAIGTARQDRDWQVILAHPLIFPELPGWQEAGRQVLDEVNRARAQARACGEQSFGPAPPLAWNGLLGQASLGHSSRLSQGRYFSHQEKDGSMPADRATRAGYAWRLVGENIASGDRTPQQAVAAWLASPGHCANIMNPRFTEMGAAYAIDPRNENLTPYWTQMFGQPR